MADNGCGCSGEGCEKLLNAQPDKLDIQTLSTSLTWRDRLGGWAVRWGIGRARYRMDPGVYRVGSPDAQAPVLVTANYKLTVDVLRSSLSGHSVWVLLLDTMGVNVWCAAGKGTFGTAELVRRIRDLRLSKLVEHRSLILPQLGAPGVAAHAVKQATGFTVHYGPVLARDIPAYLASGIRATAAMRRVKFGWKERLVLGPMEVVLALKPALGILFLFAAIDFYERRAMDWSLLSNLLPIVAAVVSGGVLVPLLLPLLPSRIFAVKGAFIGAIGATAAAVESPMQGLSAVGIILFGVALASYMGMMFTGATTFTNLAGVRLEVKWALPAIACVAVLGLLLRVAAVFL